MRTLYGLFVGIDRYHPPVPPLGGCVNDIESLAGLLGELAGGGDFRPEFRSLRDADATRAAVINEFHTHLGRAGPDDVALFCYSGHGSQEDAPPEFWHLEPDRLDETLVLYDSREPGQWDLADKELAVLVAEVAGRGAHVACILDCCHSGSGTRAALDDGVAVRHAPTDRRRRPADSFLAGALPRSQGDDKQAYSGWTVLPRGRHVLLAACQASETAKEVREDGRQHGAFTAAILAVVRQTRGAVSYRDLVKRAEAQVRLRVAQQVPQLEANDAADVRQAFLGGSARRLRPHFTLRKDRSLGWVIDGGAMHGIAGPSGGETTCLAIFDPDAALENWGDPGSALAVAEVTEVRPELSVVAVQVRDGTLDPAKAYRAVVTATPLPALGVLLAGDDAALALVRQALAGAGEQGKGSLLVREAVTQDDAALRIEAFGQGYCISRALSDRRLVSEINGATVQSARLAVEQLEHVARWEAVARLANPGSRLGDTPVDVIVHQRRRDPAGTWVWEELDPRRDIRLEYLHVDGKWEAPRLRIELRNRSASALHCALLWLGEDYLVDSTGLVPAGVELVPAGSSYAVNGGRDIYASVPKGKWEQGHTEVRDVLKLLVSTAPFDARLFEQDGLEAPARAHRGAAILPGRIRSSFERLAARVRSRALSTLPEDEELGDWAASELALTVVRPLEAANVPQAGEARELGAGVRLLGHPALRAKARLVSSAQAARDLGGLALPAALRDDPEASQPFAFEAARGADANLGVLQLIDVENPEAVSAEAPLLLRVPARLQPGEQILPFAWDGEFFLPLGVARQNDIDVEIELRQLPAPLQAADDVERGIVKSIRIMFQKVISSKLGTVFDYPRLSAVALDAGGATQYDAAPQAVRDRVAQAGRILLYVHGILGDTLGMTASPRAEVALPGVPPQRIADRYDLVLAFDYENISTGIEVTAASLGARLADVGLGPNHGKTLHVVAHSMGGLVARWFIEREGGNKVVQHLVTLGTPHAGSPWPTVQNWATVSLALALNGLTAAAWPARLLGDLVGAIEAVDVTLDQMASGSPFLAQLARSENNGVPYTVLVGNTSLIPAAVATGTVGRLLARLSPQRVLHDAASLAFLQTPNDIAVSVTSAQAVPDGPGRVLTKVEVPCDHISFFVSDAGRQALLEALRHV